MKILITGAAGQLGSYLVETLSRNNEVVGLDLRKPEFPVKGVKHVRGDIGDYRLAMDLCRSKDAIIHTAAQVSVDRSISDPIFDARENILGTVNMLETATKAMVGQFIYISSAAIFGNPVATPLGEAHPTKPLSPYGVSKLAGENYAFAFQETYGLKVTSIRPFNIYSPRQDPNSPYSGVISKFIECAKEKGPLTIHGDGTQTRDFIHATDVVGMVELCLGNPKASGQAFNCGTGKTTSIKELADAIIKISGAKCEIHRADSRKGDIKHSVADIAKAKEILGYRPSVTLKKGLAEFF
jgi:UDP-glucose 4-epimerase